MEKKDFGPFFACPLISVFSYFRYSLLHCLCTGSRPGTDPVPDRPTGGSNWFGGSVHCADSISDPVYDMAVPRTNSGPVGWRSLSH